MTLTSLPTLVWAPICRLEHVLPERGVAALLGTDTQVAVFRTHDDAVYALSNVDPFSGAAVLSRGIVGDRGSVPTVASPMHKQVFSLVTGVCLDEPDVRVPIFGVRVRHGVIEIAHRPLESCSP
jgi:nitrite reductase (NADH) small subunit